MKIRFDANQQFQLDAVAAIADVFDGQPLQSSGLSISFSATEIGELSSALTRTELGVGNNLVLSDEALLKNIVSSD